MSQPFDNRDYDVMKLNEKDAEIERLKAEQIKMFKAYDALEQKSVGQKAEIERLKAELDLSQNAVCDQIAYAHKLITELADALVQQSCWSTKVELVQRAREATNDSRRT
jgi:hypothetical protein